MRYTLAIVLAAIGAQASPQGVIPISQISDGQIQAPPATVVPSYPVGTPTPTPGTTVVVVPSSAPSVGTTVVSVPSVVPSAPGSVTVPVVVPVPSNGTATVIIPTTAPASNSTVSTGAPSGSQTSGSGSAPGPSSSGTAPPAESPGAAAANMVSFGGLALAALGMVLA